MYYNGEKQVGDANITTVGTKHFIHFNAERIRKNGESIIEEKFLCAGNREILESFAKSEGLKLK